MIYKHSRWMNRGWISDLQFFSDKELPGEIWQPLEKINEHRLNSSYQISNKGRIRNSNNHILKTSITDDGYDQANICDVNFRVHIAVLTVFNGPPPVDMINPTVHHINHNKLDNRVENLCWMSAFDNNQEGHGVECKLEYCGEELTFASQKQASLYLNRYEDYIAECVRNGYVVTDANKVPVRLWLRIESGWHGHVPKHPSNRNRCKIETASDTIEFRSFWKLDEYLSRPKGYISNLVANSWPVSDPIKTLYLWDDQNQEFVQYVSTRLKSTVTALRCKLITTIGEVLLFDSIAAVARYIGRDAEYVRLNLKAGKPVKNAEGEVVNLQFVD